MQFHIAAWPRPSPTFGHSYMRDFDPLSPLIFIHIPKTAGSAVRKVVERWFPDRFVQHYYNEASGEMPDLLPLKSAKFLNTPPIIYGHFNKHRGFGVEDYYPEVSQFVTILRDPFEVAISHYFYTRKASKNWRDKSRVPTDSLEKHIRFSELNILNHFPREVTIHNFKDLLEEHFIEVGITEELPKSLGLIARKLGKEFNRSELEVVNATERNQPSPEQYRDQFYEKHRLEYSVYEYAKSRISGISETT